MHEWDKCFDEYFSGNFADVHLEQKLKEPNKFQLIVPNPVFITLTEETPHLKKNHSGISKTS